MVGSQSIPSAETSKAVCDHASILRELPYLRRFARALTNNPASADDLVHDCVVKALENTEKFAPGTNLRAWLFTILRNCFISDIRRNRRVTTIPEGTRWAADGVSAPAQDDVVMLNRVQAEIVKLPPNQREVLVLVVLENMSYEQTAQMLKLPIGTVRSRLSRARHSLTVSLEGKAKTETRVAYRPAGAPSTRLPAQATASH